MRAFLIVATCAVLGASCARTRRVQNAIDGLQAQLADNERRNAAHRCAPRFLAHGEASLLHAVDELDRGNSERADEHVFNADINLRTAFRLADLCRQDTRNDGDHLHGPRDQCPGEAEDIDGFQDDDGCPELQDTDGDGIDDARDLCPSTAEDLDGYLDEDGCPDWDNDFDGIPDEDDACPLVPDDSCLNSDAGSGKEPVEEPAEETEEATTDTPEADQVEGVEAGNNRETETETE